MQSHAQPSDAILRLDPLPALLARTRSELSAAFDPARPMRVSRAPGRLDVMGGIADYTGSLVAEATLDRAAGVVLQERTDRELQIFSFNLFDDHLPFTFRIPLQALAGNAPDALRQEFAQPGRRWAAYLAGCLVVLHEHDYIDLNDPKTSGINLALLSTVPLGVGVSSSAAIEVATMLNLVDHFGLREPSCKKRIADGVALAALCQEVENRIVGAPCGIMDQVTCCLGTRGALLRMICQPHQLQRPLPVPAGVHFVGINSNVKHSISGAAYGQTRCAAFIGHKIILETMRAIGNAAGHELIGDPMHGYLANLNRDDYKAIFRARIPETISGKEFLDRYGATIDTATTVDPTIAYEVRHATDHHVLEARRVERFAEYLEKAMIAPDKIRRGGSLDRAGHLMYASHQSYTMDAMLGAEECDLIVALVRKRERAGLYGARITGGGGGGTVAVLADLSASADAAIDEISVEYERQTGRRAEIFRGSSDGAWHSSTYLIPAS